MNAEELPEAPPVGPGERLEMVSIHSEVVHRETGKVLKALAESDAMDGLSPCEVSIVMGYVFGIYMQGAQIKLKPDVPVRVMLPMVCAGYRDAEEMRLAENLKAP